MIGETTEYQISEINNLLEEKQKELIKLANKGQDYEHLADEIDELRDKRQTPFSRRCLPQWRERANQ